MSWLVRVQTRLTEQEYLVRALEACGYRLEQGLAKRLSSEVAFAAKEVVARSAEGRQIGFRRGKQGFEAIAAGSDRKRLKSEVARITQQYAYLQVVDKAKQQGFDVAETVTQEDGTIQVVVRRWA